MSRLTLIILTICFFFSLPEYLLAKNLGSWLEKAQALEKDGFWDEAAEAYKKFTKTNSNPKLVIYARLRLGIAYLKLGQFQRSIDTSKLIVKFHPENFDAYFHLANSLSAIGRFSRAAEAYKKTTALKPEEGLGYVGHGLSLFGNRNSQKAIKELLKANKLFKKKRNISWYRDTRVMITQIKHFEKFPPHFSDLWLNNTLKLVRDTYEKAVFNSKHYLQRPLPKKKFSP